MSVRPTTFGVTVTAILLGCVTYLEMVPERKAFAPKLPFVSSCGELMPGMRRIGDYGFQFDFALEKFRSNEGWGDMPPGPHGFTLRPKNSASRLDISWHSGWTTVGRVPEIEALTSSGYSAKRQIFDDKGQVIGEDSWGYWGDERWRRVHLLGWVAASYGSRNKGELTSYGSVSAKEAGLFDGVISTACRMAAPSR